MIMRISKKFGRFKKNWGKFGGVFGILSLKAKLKKLFENYIFINLFIKLLSLINYLPSTFLMNQIFVKVKM